MLYHIALRFHEGTDDETVIIPLTHQNIANLVGIARETASLELQSLRKEGYIGYGKQNNIRINITKLREIIDTA